MKNIKFYEVVWNDNDFDCATETVLGRFDTVEEAEELVAKLGGGQVDWRVMPEDIVEPGPSAKWSVFRSAREGDSVSSIVPIGEDDFRYSEGAMYSDEYWSADVYGKTKEDAIKKFCDHFDLVWDGRKKGISAMLDALATRSLSIPPSGEVTTFTWGWADKKEGRE